jgi:hypothetical protein
VRRLFLVFINFSSDLFELVADFFGEYPFQDLVGGELDGVLLFDKTLLICGYSGDLSCQKSKR